MSKMSLLTASVITEERDELVTEIYYEDDQWAELSENGRLTLYPHRTGELWVFDYQEAIDALLEARALFKKFPVG